MGNEEQFLDHFSLRNASICPLKEGVAYSASFNEERVKLGWDFVENGSVFGVSGGFLFFSALTNLPSIGRAASFAPVDSAVFTELVIRMRYKRAHGSGSYAGKIQFTTSSDIIFDDIKSTTFTVSGDDAWHTYYINMGQVSKWVGNITNLKIFPNITASFGDEIFISDIRIQNPNYEFCSIDCVKEVSEELIADNFDTQTLNNNPADYSLSNIDNLRTISIQADPKNNLNKAMRLKNQGSLLGPIVTKQASRAVNSGFWSFRFYTTNFEPKFKLMESVSPQQEILELRLNTSGKLAYRTGVNTYTEIGPVLALNTWHDILIIFDGDQDRYQVFLDGQELAKELPYIFSGQVAYIRYEYTAMTSGILYLDEVVLVEEFEQSGCQGLGRQGFALGSLPYYGSITVSSDNTSVIVNLDNYGDVVVKIPAKESYSIEEIAAELEGQLSKLDLGGYYHCEVGIEDGKIRIRSGTYSFDSTVAVKKHKNSVLSFYLGFSDLEGNPTYQSKNGRPNSRNFVIENNFRPATIDLNGIKGFSPLVYDPSNYAIEIGARDAGQTGRQVQVDGKNKTFIDLSHRATTEGLIEQVFCHAVFPQTSLFKYEGSGDVLGDGSIFNTKIFDFSIYEITTGDILQINSLGYTGNGSYKLKRIERTGLVELEDGIFLPTGTNLSFGIHNLAKLKQFRPSSSGTLNLINEQEIATTTSGSLYSRTIDTAEVNVDWYVKRGDLVGIYNPLSLYVGNDANDEPDAFFLQDDGDVSSFDKVALKAKGDGVRGLGLYGRGSARQDKAIIDIEIPENQVVNFIELEGVNKSSKVYYNLFSAIGIGGVSFAPQVSGTHIHQVEDNNANILQIVHPNIGYNPQTLTDGVEFASNGFLGSFEATIQGASYFYINGDSEFASYVYNDQGNLVEDSLEFPLHGPLLFLRTTDYFSDMFKLKANWNVPKTIGRLKMNFKDFPNAVGHWLEYYKGNGIFDGSDLGFEKIGQGNFFTYKQVNLDHLLLTPETVTGSVLERFFHTRFDGYTTFEKSEDAAAVQKLYRTPFTIIDRYFDSITTNAFNWVCSHHESTKISEIELFGVLDKNNTDFASNFELYFSVDGKIFQRADPLPLGSDRVRFRISYPTKLLRLVMKPTAELEVRSLRISSNHPKVKYKDFETEDMIEEVHTEPLKDQFSPVYRFQVQNRTGQEANCELELELIEAEELISFKSPLDSPHSIDEPDIGPPGYVYQDGDYPLVVTSNVAINCKNYGLKNLAENKPYFLCENYDDESDLFTTHVNTFKWSTFYTNFPKGPPGAMQLQFPGFTMTPHPGPLGEPAVFTQAELRSKWDVTGDFSMEIEASYDLINAIANDAATTLGLIDSTGRTISISKNRFNYQDGNVSPQRKYAEYRVSDSASPGVNRTITAFCLTPTRCGGVTFGVEDDNVEYKLVMTKTTLGPDQYIRFYYIDPVNGAGTTQFDQSLFYQFKITVPLIGPVKAFIRNNWNPNGDALTGVVPAKNYVRINRFSFGGSSSYTRSYIFQPGPHYTTSSGFVGVDNRVGSITEQKHFALDLNRRYALDITQNYTKTGHQLWNPNNFTFSNTESSDPNQVDWGNTDQFDARWVRLSEKAVSFTPSGTFKYIDYLRLYPNITILPPRLATNSTWEELPALLTDGDRQTFFTQDQYPVIAVSLPAQFEIKNFQLLNRSDNEYVQNNITFDGWSGPGGFSTFSDSLTDDPMQAGWSTWSGYQEENKPIQPMKWVAFKNVSDIATKKYAATFTAETRNISTRQESGLNDRVQVTNYAQYFDVAFLQEIDLALVSGTDFGSEGVLFSGSEIYNLNNANNGRWYNSFDGYVETETFLKNDPAHLWRVFGSLEAVSGTTSVVLSGTEVFELSNTSIQSFVVNYEPQTVNGFKIAIPLNSPGIPDRVRVQTLTGNDPTSPMSWGTIYDETGLSILTTSTDFSQVPVFNGGGEYKIFFSTPIVASGLKVLFSDIDYTSTNDQGMTISSFEILKTFDQDQTQLVTLENDPAESRALKITYLTGNDTSVKITAGSALEINSDPLWSVQDFFAFDLSVSNPSMLYLENCFIRLGNSSEKFYQWNFTDLRNEITSLLSTNKLKFLDAEVKGEGSIDFFNLDLSILEPQVDFINKPIRFFQIEIKPLALTTEDLVIEIEGLKIERNNFEDGIYLNNNEFVYLPLTSLSPARGSLEMTIRPDWDAAGFRSTRTQEVFTFFTLVNGADSTLSCYYDSRRGLSVSSSNGGKQTQFSTGLIDNIQKYKPFKLGLVWDHSTLLSIFFNDFKMGDFNSGWEIDPTLDSYLFLGSRAYSSDVALDSQAEYNTAADPFKLAAKIYSVTGFLSDLVISDQAQKFEYADFKQLKDFIYISIDGVNYLKASEAGLPFIINNLATNDVIDVHLKTMLPRNTINLNRVAKITSKWRFK